MIGNTEKREVLNKKYNFGHENPVRCGQCDRLLGVFEIAKGEIKCPRCKNIQKVNVEYSSKGGQIKV